MVVVMMAMVVPGFGGRFGSGAPEKKCCSDHGDRRTRPGKSSRHRLFGLQHM
jgi:hypothetical protein